MALSHQIEVTANGLKEALPNGYSAPVVSNVLTDPIVLPARNFTIAASGNVNASAATGLTNLITALDTAIETHLTGTSAGQAGLNSAATLVAVSTITNTKRQAREDSESKFETGGDEVVFTVVTRYEVQ